MDLIERQVKHGRWFSNMFLDAALPLSDEQLDREFDFGQRTYRKTAVELVNGVERETAWLTGVPAAEPLPEGASIAEVLEAHDLAFDKFEVAAREITADGSDKAQVTYIDNYNIPQSYGGTLLFVIMQNQLRISELRSFLERLGVEVGFEGDIQEWEHFSSLIDSLGGQYPEGFVRPWVT